MSVTGDCPASLMVMTLDEFQTLLEENRRLQNSLDDARRKLMVMEGQIAISCRAQPSPASELSVLSDPTPENDVAAFNIEHDDQLSPILGRRVSARPSFHENEAVIEIESDDDDIQFIRCVSPDLVLQLSESEEENSSNDTNESSDVENELSDGANEPSDAGDESYDVANVLQLNENTAVVESSVQPTVELDILLCSDKSGNSPVLCESHVVTLVKNGNLSVLNCYDKDMDRTLCYDPIQSTSLNGPMLELKKTNSPLGRGAPKLAKINSSEASLALDEQNRNSFKRSAPEEKETNLSTDRTSLELNQINSSLKGFPQEVSRIKNKNDGSLLVLKETKSRGGLERRNSMRLASKVIINVEKEELRKKSVSRKPVVRKIEKEPSSAGPTFCGKCSLLFSSPNYLMKHMKQSHPSMNNRFRCQHCSYSTDNTSNLKVHLHRHTGDKPFPCKECGKAFCTKQSLMRHSWVHKSRAEYQFQCKVCKKRFYLSRHLTVHSMIHTGDKPIQCGECDKQFILRNAFLAHQRKSHGVCSDQNKSLGTDPTLKHRVVGDHTKAV